MDSLSIAFGTKQARSTEDAALRNAVGPLFIQEDRYSRSEEMRKSTIYLSQLSHEEGHSTFPTSSYCRWSQRSFWRASEVEELERSTRPKQRSAVSGPVVPFAWPIEEQIIEDYPTEVDNSGSSSISQTRKSLTCPYTDFREAYPGRILLENHLRTQHSHEKTEEVMARSEHIGIRNHRSWIASDRIYDQIG